MKSTTSALCAAILCLTVTQAFAADTNQIVTNAMTELMINKKVDQIDKHFAEPYIQHNQTVPSGLEGLKGLADAAIAKNPGFNYELVRVLAEGDLGVAHGIYQGFGPVPLVAFDVFRVENGKIVEHWDNLQPVASPNPSGRSQTDGATQPVDLDMTAANKAFVEDFMNTVLIGGNFAELPDYFDGDNYIQHNPNIGDGLSGLGAGLKALADAGLNMRINKLHRSIAEGNFVLTMSEGTIGDKPTAFYDLFRVENGKIAEHWDVIADILPDQDAANSNGKF